MRHRTWALCSTLFVLFVSAPAAAQFPTASFAESEVTVNENAGSVTLTVLLNGTGNNGGIGYQTLDGSAEAGSDYQSQSSFLFWPPGDSSPRTITIPIVPTAEIEPPETFQVRLAYGDGVEAGDPAIATVTIVEGGLSASFVLDDAVEPNIHGEYWIPAEGGEALPVTIRLSEPPQGAVTVDYQIDDGPPVSVVFDGVQEKTVMIPSPPQPGSSVLGTVQIRIVQVGKRDLSDLARIAFGWFAGDDCVNCAFNLLMSLAGFTYCDNACAVDLETTCFSKEQRTTPDLLRRYRDEVLAPTAGGQFYVGLYEDLTGHIATGLLRQPGLVYEILNARNAWLDGIDALVQGNGDGYTVTAQMLSDLTGIVEDLAAVMEPSAAQQLQAELARLDVASLTGATMTQFQQRVETTGGGVATEQATWGAIKSRFER